MVGLVVDPHELIALLLDAAGLCVECLCLFCQGVVSGAFLGGEGVLVCRAVLNNAYDELLQYGDDVLEEEGEGPREGVCKVREDVGVLDLKELLDHELIGHDLQEGSAVNVLITIVWCGENSEDRCDWEGFFAVGKVFKVAVLLNLVAAYDAAEVVAAEELLDGCEAVEVAGVAESV